jgi:hypothetical protein
MIFTDFLMLLTQVDKVIIIFEEAYPSCITLFVFDQSFAHTLLGPDALHAFEMNKSNGGSQRKQKDTVIPMTNMCPEFCGKAQKLVTTVPSKTFLTNLTLDPKPLYLLI